MIKELVLNTLARMKPVAEPKNTAPAQEKPIDQTSAATRRQLSLLLTGMFFRNHKVKLRARIGD